MLTGKKAIKASKPVEPFFHKGVALEHEAAKVFDQTMGKFGRRRGK
jgi:hypothetical protein